MYNQPIRPSVDKVGNNNNIDNNFLTLKNQI